MECNCRPVVIQIGPGRLGFETIPRRDRHLGLAYETQSVGVVEKWFNVGFHMPVPDWSCLGCSYVHMSKHNTICIFTVALGSKGMPICATCRKWSLLAGNCSVCVSAHRLVAAATGPRLPPTQEAQFKVTKILDGAFYSIGRLLPEEDSPERGEAAPSDLPGEEGQKGEASPKPPAEAKEETVESKPKEAKPSASTTVEEKGVSPYLQLKEEKEESTKGVATPPRATEERKPLPRRKEEEKEGSKRSRSPKRRQEKEKKRRRRRDSRSGEVSGSEVRRQKRETTGSQKEKREKEEITAKDPAIEREPYLRPRPTQRRPRSPHTPERPPPERSSGSKGGGKGKPQGKGWRGPVPYSSHPRWTQGTNKGITKRAKQELQDRKNQGRGGRRHW